MARLQAGLAALLLGGYFLLILNVTGVAGPGGMMAFTMFSGIAFYVCLFVGATATADAISSEKREGTLGLLFLTDLRAYDVLAGKLASHGLHLAYLLVATVPALAVPVLAGGVTAKSLALQSLVLLNTLFFSCAVGLLVSTYSREARRARVMAFLMVLAILTLPFLVAFWGQERGWSASATVGIAFFSPASSLRAALAVTGFAAPFWPGFLITHGYAWLFLGLAAWRLPRSWQERPAGVKGQRWRAWRTEPAAAPRGLDGARTCADRFRGHAGIFRHVPGGKPHLRAGPVSPAGQGWVDLGRRCDLAGAPQARRL